MKHLSCLLSGLALLGPACAHDAFFAPDPAQPGWYHVRFADDGKPLAYAPAKLRRAWAIGPGGEPTPMAPQAGAGDLRVQAPADARLLALAFDNGFYSRTAQGTVPRPMHEVPGAVSAVWARKTAKYVVRWDPQVTRPLGLELEVVPQDAAPPRAGGTITVQLLAAGQPVPGVKVSASEHAPGPRTDADGRATLPVQAGRNVVWAERRTRIAGDPTHDALAIATNLVFEAP